MDISLFVDSIEILFSPADSSLLLGLMLGTTPSSSPIVEEMKSIGTYHLMVASGSNTAYITSFCMRFSRLISRKMSLLITIPFIIYYLIICRYEAPILRSSIMAITTVVGELAGRRTIPGIMLLFSAILSIIFEPTLCTSLSFLLSYSATFGIIFASEQELHSVEPPRHKCTFSIAHHLLRELKISFSAQIFTLPFQIVYFSTIPTLGSIASIATAWIVPPLIISTIIAVITEHIPLGLHESAVVFATLGCSYIRWITHSIFRIPFHTIRL